MGQKKLEERGSVLIVGIMDRIFFERDGCENRV
jgi:hypothetical protein